jgi:hypothetical protein
VKERSILFGRVRDRSVAQKLFHLSRRLLMALQLDQVREFRVPQEESARLRGASYASPIYLQWERERLEKLYLTHAKTTMLTPLAADL